MDMHGVLRCWYLISISNLVINSFNLLFLFSIFFSFKLLDMEIRLYYIYVLVVLSYCLQSIFLSSSILDSHLFLKQLFFFHFLFLVLPSPFGCQNTACTYYGLYWHQLTSMANFNDSHTTHYFLFYLQLSFLKLEFFLLCCNLLFLY